jgi:hypothetical protein
MTIRKEPLALVGTGAPQTLPTKERNAIISR